MSGRITLPARLDTSAADALETMLEGEGGIEIDASAVDMIGGLCLEVVSSAIKRRRDSGATVTIDNVSDGFGASLATLGLDADGLQSGGYAQ